MTKEMSDKIRAQRLAMPRATLAEAQAQAKRVMAAGRKAKGCRNRRSQQRFVSCEQVRAAIEAEEELPGEMPDEIWAMLKSDKQAAAEVLRANVRAMKRNIKERLGL